MKVALPNDVNSKMKGVEDPDKAIFNECIPTKNPTVYLNIVSHNKHGPNTGKIKRDTQY